MRLTSSRFARLASRPSPLIVGCLHHDQTAQSARGRLRRTPLAMKNPWTPVDTATQGSGALHALGRSSWSFRRRRPVAGRAARSDNRDMTTRLFGRLSAALGIQAVPAGGVVVTGRPTAIFLVFAVLKGLYEFGVAIERAREAAAS